MAEKETTQTVYLVKHLSDETNYVVAAFSTQELADTYASKYLEVAKENDPRNWVSVFPYCIDQKSDVEVKTIYVATVFGDLRVGPVETYKTLYNRRQPFVEGIVYRAEHPTLEDYCVCVESIISAEYAVNTALVAVGKHRAEQRLEKPCN